MIYSNYPEELFAQNGNWKQLHNDEISRHKGVRVGGIVLLLGHTVAQQNHNLVFATAQQHPASDRLFFQVEDGTDVQITCWARSNVS
jgi:hypothetical protein